MKHSKHFVLLFFIAALMAGTVQAQGGKLNRANKLYDKMAYAVAIPVYEKLVKKDPNNVEAREKLGDCYRIAGQPDKAAEQYKAAIDLGGTKAITKFHYGQVLMSQGKYDEAKKAFEDYERTGENAALARRCVGACEEAKEMRLDSAQYRLAQTNINTKASDFAAVPYEKGLVYTSARRRGFFSRAKDLQTNTIFYDLYYAEPKVGKQKPIVKGLSGKVNTRFHDGPAVFSKDGKTMYFTRSNFVDGKVKKDKTGKNNLKVLKATLNGSKWGDVEVLGFNNDEYSCGHPALSPDGNVLIFASDKPGGFGGTDLYQVRKQGDSWSEPENMGPRVNTARDELFPSFDPEGTLFFASDGHAGMGGLDVFALRESDDGSIKIENMGYPLNSEMDDFGISWIKRRPRGYVSSNRPGGLGRDDVWQFSRKTRITIEIVDSRTKDKVPNANVVILDQNGRQSSYATDDEGKIKHYGDWNQNYQVTVTKDEYDPRKEMVRTTNISPTENLEVSLEINPSTMFTISGIVKDKTNGQPIEGADIRLVGNGPESRVQTDSEGKYESDLEEENEYFVVVTKKGYTAGVKTLTTKGKTEPEDFEVNFELNPGKYLLVDGRVIRKDNRAPLADAVVRAIATELRKELQSMSSRSDGRFIMSLNPEVDQYLLIGSKERFFSSRVELPKPVNLPNDTTINATIEMVRYEEGALVKLIYFDYDKSSIRRDASKELYEIIFFLLDNPEAMVELSTHTDSRGGNVYNNKLSQSRADSAVYFIVERGVAKERITAKGYGESKLVNKCRDGVNCTEEQHQANRRAEVKVTAITGEGRLIIEKIEEAKGEEEEEE